MNSLTNNKKLFCAVTVIILIFVIAGLKNYTKLTYLEYEIVNEEYDGYIQLATSGDVLSQEFYAPYDLLKGVSIKIGTFARDNNSMWNIAVIEKRTGEILYEKDYNASLIVDNDFHLFEFKKSVHVKRGDVYIIQISAIDVNNKSSLAFYQLPNAETGNLKLYLNGAETGSEICFAMYGGDIDIWWLGYTILIAALVLVMVIRYFCVKSMGLKTYEDKLFMSTMTSVIVLLLLCSFSVAGIFTDEYDNITGGMIIANGGVLYKDYVTQHTPVTYYLCAVFALFGAGSVAQFRLSYYLVESIVWGILYYRHVDFFGNKKMLFLPILESIFITSVVPYGFQILSDGVQGLCMVALMLEFVRYYNDKKLDWGRSIIISICMWGSFGSAFVSVYAIMWVVLVVLLTEIFDHAKVKCSFEIIIARYYKLCVSLIIPLICAIVYFKINHSLRRAFEQFYTFNREVYSKYLTNGLGSNIMQPFINGIQYFFAMIADNINAIITASASNIAIIQLIIVVAATVAIIIIALKKRYVEAFLFFMVMCYSATRGYGFHGLAAYYVAIMLIAIFYDELLSAAPKRIGIPCTAIISIYLLSVYVGAVGDNLLYEQTSISELESRVVKATRTGEGILIDAYYCNSIYFLYKDRYPVNRAVYMLPWYMDWYEKDTIEDLNTNLPRVVVYNEDQITWGYTHYANAFVLELKQNYTRISEDPETGWKYRLWFRNY